MREKQQSAEALAAIRSALPDEPLVVTADAFDPRTYLYVENFVETSDGRPRTLQRHAVNSIHWWHRNAQNAHDICSDGPFR